MAEASHSVVRRRILRVLYWIMAFFALGYFPTLLLGDFRVSLIVAGVAAIPVGSLAQSRMQGWVRGALLGLVAGTAIVFGLAQFQVQRESIVTAQLATICVVSTVLLCAAVSALFAHLAVKRKRNVEDRWR